MPYYALVFHTSEDPTLVIFKSKLHRDVYTSAKGFHGFHVECVPANDRAAESYDVGNAAESVVNFGGRCESVKIAKPFDHFKLNSYRNRFLNCHYAKAISELRESKPFGRKCDGTRAERFEWLAKCDFVAEVFGQGINTVINDTID